MAHGLTVVPVLEARDLVKAYGGLRAVDGISFTVQPGEILGVVGPNGAGKTTLFDVITGHTRPTGGQVFVDGTNVTRAPVHVRCHRGVARTFQQPLVAASLTVLENMVLATTFSRHQRRDAAFDAAHGWLDFIDLVDRANDLAGALDVFDTKRLMLGTALATDARVLLLDEPFGGLNAAEIDLTMDLIRRTQRGDLGVVCIEHVMRALTALADRVLVMHHGSALFTGTPEAMLADERVVDVYLGDRGRKGARS